MQVLAPAKINLSLKILGPRSDEFHEIETFIAPISLYDELKIERRTSKQGIEFRCNDPSVPQGAGLGGGSSDAASTLIALNELFEAKLTREALAKMAEGIGSDVPFFNFQSAAICRGRGALVSPIKLRKPLFILLLKPQFGVSTAWAYQRWRGAREIPGVSYAAQEFAGRIFVNDLERSVFEKFVFLAQLKVWLLEQPEVRAALMSGSGSTVFAVMRERADARQLAKRAKAALDP